MFSEFSVRAQQWRDFATAHSCGLRHGNKCCATCGHYLCHSAFARVATCAYLASLFASNFATAHSRGLRLARSKCAVKRVSFATAHSCGLRLICARVVDNAAHFATAHSCGLRPARACGSLNAISLCHSAFVRVATLPKSADLHGGTSFATAHSCGLRLRKSNAAHCEFAARR